MQKAVTLSLLVSASLAAPQAAPAVFPATGENGQMGGIFGMGMPALNAEQLKNNQITKFGSAVFSYVGKPKADGKPGLLSSLGSYAGKVDPNVLLSKIVPQGPEYPQGKLTLADFYDPGSGKYPAHFVAEKTLANHTIYAPKNPPPSDVKMPVLIWGNGGCTAGGTSYATFLTEVASHGYLAIANGPPGSGPPSLSYPGSPQAAVPGPNGEAPDPNAVVFAGFSKIKDMTAAMDWVTAGNADKYGNIDKNSFITAGSSCGGLEAYSGAYHDDRVKLIGVFNSGVIDPKKKYLLKELKAKVALIQGGPKDIGFENVRFPQIDSGTLLTGRENRVTRTSNYCLRT